MNANVFAYSLRRTVRVVWQCSVALLLVGVGSSRVFAQIPSCAAITSNDVAPVVGAAAMKSTTTGCSWRGDPKHFVLILDNTPKSNVMPIDAMFGAARNAASQSGTVTDEKGLGDKAFLAISSSGVAALQMLKGGHLIQVQLWDGTATPSAANLALIKSIAAKAIAKL